MWLGIAPGKSMIQWYKLGRNAYVVLYCTTEDLLHLHKPDVDPTRLHLFVEFCTFAPTTMPVDSSSSWNVTCSCFDNIFNNLTPIIFHFYHTSYNAVPSVYTSKFSGHNQMCIQGEIQKVCKNHRKVRGPRMQYTLGLFNLRPSYIRGSRHTLHIRQLWLFLSALICRSAFAMSVDNANHSQQDLSRKSKKSRGKHEPSGGHIIASEVKEGRQGIMQERGATEQFVEGTKRDKKRKKRHEEGIAHVQHESHGVSDGKPSKLKRRKEHLDGPKGKFKDLSDEKKRKAEIDDEDVAAHDNTEQLSNGMGDGENSGHETGGEEERKGGQTQPNKTRQKRRAHGTGEEIIRDEQKIKTKKGKKRKDTVDAREERDGAREVHRRKKRRRGTLEFADPNEDEVLSDQARKGVFLFLHNFTEGLKSVCCYSTRLCVHALQRPSKLEIQQGSTKLAHPQFLVRRSCKTIHVRGTFVLDLTPS